MNMSDVLLAQMRELEASACIAQVMRAGHPIIVAYSGGKDSTVVLALTLDTARTLKEHGYKVPPIVVTHGNTGIENPTVSLLAEGEMEKVREFGRQHGLVIRAEVAHPSLNDTWAVSVISGRKLPTFANSGSRDCTTSYKIVPMLRLRKKLLAELGATGKTPVTLVGTRFEESTGRAARMNERGESDLVPWEKDGSWFMSPVANWTSDDVWEYIGRMRTAEVETFTDGEDVFELYAAGGGTTCAVVSDMATEAIKKTRACGARFGCSLCAAVGRDKSLENMLESDPSYGWLRGVNRIQRFIVDTQWDMDRRHWLGRSIDEAGFVQVGPDAYAPRMLKELLRYCLTVDVEEQEAAAAAGLAHPRFQLVTPTQLIAIDALWGLHGIDERPFAAVDIWLDVYQGGARYHPPENMVAFPKRSMPTNRYLHVGKNDWDQGMELTYTGFRDPLYDMVNVDAERNPNRRLASGLDVLPMQESDFFDVDEEGAVLFLHLEAERVLNAYAKSPSSKSFLYYSQLGILSTSTRHMGTVDEIMRRTNWRRRYQLTGEIDREHLLSMSVSKTERDLCAAEPERLQLHGPLPQLPLRHRLCQPVYI